MNLIVAVDKNWGIGYQNKLLNSIPEDMKYFRETTTGKVVVMGRKTPGSTIMSYKSYIKGNLCMISNRNQPWLTTPIW